MDIGELALTNSTPESMERLLTEKPTLWLEGSLETVLPRAAANEGPLGRWGFSEPGLPGSSLAP